MPKLTNPIIAEATANGREFILWDDSFPGFGVRIKPTGRKTFIVQYRNRAGRARRLTIAKYGILTLTEARKEALKILADVSKGADPTEERQRLRQSETIKGLSQRYMREHCEGRCKPSTMDAHKWLFEKLILPRIGRLKLGELARSDIAKMHAQMRKTPFNANRALQLVKAMLNWAENQELIEKHSNPAVGLKMYPEPKRERFLNNKELRELLSAIKEAEADGDITTHIAAAIRLLIFTGCRVGEILSLKWENVDLDQQRLTITEHKTSKFGAKIIPLNPPALMVIENLPRIEGNPYVIAGRRSGAGLVNIQKPWRRVRARAGLDDLRLHDLRHSFASFAVSAGISLPIIGGLLGHRSVQTTARYAHLAHKPLKDASDKIASVFEASSI